VDTNFVFRGPAGLRTPSGARASGGSLRNTLSVVDGDLGLVAPVFMSQPFKGREGHAYGGGCDVL
jgi:hypothetical protein